MTNKEFYQISTQGKGALMSIPRKIHYFISRHFYRKLLNLIQDQGRDLSKYRIKFDTKFEKLNQKLDRNTKDITIQKENFRAVIGDYQARHMDFDAILHRLGFIEQKLRETDSKFGETESKLNEIANSVGPSARLVLGKRTNEIVITEPALTINHGPYGDFILRDPDVVGDCIREGGFWDEHLRDLIIRYSDYEGLAVDAGAYVGFHSCFLAKYFGKVVSFEPQPKIFRMLAANLLLNGHDNVEIYNFALYDRECFMRVADQDKQEVPLVLKDGKVDYSVLKNAGGLTFEVSESSNNSVQAYPIDSLKLENVKFIKIDTQGSDLKVLQGARETIRRCRPVIVFEYENMLSEAHQSSMDDYEKFFHEMSYDLHELRSHENKQFDYCAIPKKIA